MYDALAFTPLNHECWAGCRYTRPFSLSEELLTSHQATAWVCERSKAKGSELLVLFVIANHAHPDGHGAYPSQRTLASECKMSVRGIQYILERLAGLGDIEILTRQSAPGDPYYGTNEYFIPGVMLEGFYKDKPEMREDDPTQSLRTGTQTTRRPDASTVRTNLELKQELKSSTTEHRLLNGEVSKPIPKPIKEKKSKSWPKITYSKPVQAIPAPRVISVEDDPFPRIQDILAADEKRRRNA